jgi:hypothetical protein
MWQRAVEDTEGFRENFMRFDLPVRCVLQNVSLVRETFHQFAILPFHETSRLAFFTHSCKTNKNKRNDNLFHLFHIFCKTEVNSFVWKREVNISFSILLLFREMFHNSLFCETDVKQAKTFAKLPHFSLISRGSILALLC